MEAQLSNPQPRRPAPGLLPLLQAMVADDARFDLGALAPGVVDRALDNGLGAVMARVSRALPVRAPHHADAIQAADLTARVLTAEVIDVVAGILRLADGAGCHLVLLKGCATGVRYYPEPHLRTMGDVDLLAGAGDAARVETLLRADGFVDTSVTHPPAWYELHHHRVPLWHPQRRLWIELHSSLYPPFSPLGHEPRLSPAAVADMVTAIPIDGGSARVFTHELQLVYTATRWADMPNLQRGAFPVLDSALLLARHGAALDWDRVLWLVDGAWGTTALRLMLSYLERWELATIPRSVAQQLARRDRFTNRALIRVLHRLITTFVMDGRPLGPVVTSRNWRTTWSTTIGPAAPWTKPFRLAANLAFPPKERERPAGR